MLREELWLRALVTRFLGELIFSHGRMTIAIEVVEIALAVVTRQIDLAPVVLAETYHGLDRISHRYRHFHGCRALVQVWLAGHLGMEILLPQRSAFETYFSSSHARAIQSVREEYEKLAKLTEDNHVLSCLSSLLSDYYIESTHQTPQNHEEGAIKP